MATILVTGGAGFLGSNLCRALAADPENQVIALDNLYTGRMENILSLMDKDNFRFIKADVCDPIDLEVDQIYNAACPASPPAYQKNPTSTTKTCVLGIINMLDLATRCNATLLQFSTSEVYGEPEVHPQSETYRGSVNPIGIRSCYDEGKRCAESLCFDYRREFGTKIKVVRIFNTYGPHMDPEDGRVVSNFILQALRQENITIYGDGSQTRSFCYVDDLVRGLIAMMNSPEDFTGPVNLGNPGEYTMLELADLIIEKTQSTSRLIFKPLPADDPTHRQPDIARAKQALGWQPQTPLTDGLDHTIRYYKELL
ncbi:MAG: SDR family oxidoreductase [Clostridia bacterium]|nr:SDR family oxidoreductase [Clostridia bacterium]